MNQKIILYTISNCTNCQIVKNIFEQYKISFEEKNIEKDFQAENELINLTNGRKSIPSLRVGNTIYQHIKPHEAISFAQKFQTISNHNE